jgi:MOSC domain-containing protein YiiM
MRPASVHSINVSNGGVPKAARPSARITVGGVEGDRQRDLRYHGGADRAVCVYSLELIEALQTEGHSIEPGSIGENLTLVGLDWVTMAPGTRLEIGTVTLEVTKPAFPCRKIADSFRVRDFSVISAKVRPGWSRFYCRVLREGVVAVGDPVRLVAACGGDE